MVASLRVEILFYKGVRQKRGRGFGAFAQVIKRTAIPFLCKDLVPAAKNVGGDLLEFTALEITEFVSGGKKFKTAAKNVVRQILRQQLGSGSKKNCKQSHCNKIFKTNQPVAKRNFCKSF